MGMYLQACALVLVAVILILLLNRDHQNMGLLITLAACCLICGAVGSFLEPVVEFIRRLRQVGQLDDGLVTILLKCTGISFLSELMGLVCADAGQASLGKALRMLSAGTILFLSLPLLEELVSILEEVLMKI